MKTQASFEDLVSKVCVRRGLTLPELGVALGVSEHTVRSWLKQEAASARTPPGWVGVALRALLTGRTAVMRRGGLLVAYRPLTRLP